jgi:hypothetical protein
LADLSTRGSPEGAASYAIIERRPFVMTDQHDRLETALAGRRSMI